MSIESIPIRVSMTGDCLIRSGSTYYPFVKIMFNDKVVFGPKEVINNDDGLYHANFEIDYDDEGTEECKLSIFHDTPGCEDIKYNPETDVHDDFSIHLKNIEINEISMDNLIWSHGIVSVSLSLEKDYDKDGFIHAFLIPEKREEELFLKPTKQEDGTTKNQYWWIAPGDYLHGDNAHYDFTFTPPLYIWLLEILLD